MKTIYNFDIMKAFKIEYTIWRVVDSHWVNISREFTDLQGNKHTKLYDGTLADYLWLVGFDIPDSIKYCLAENNEYNLKYRCFGSKIHIYLTPNK